MLPVQPAQLNVGVSVTSWPTVIDDAPTVARLDVGAGRTVTVATACTVAPAAFCAINVYVLLAVGLAMLSGPASALGTGVPPRSSLMYAVVTPLRLGKVNVMLSVSLDVMIARSTVKLPPENCGAATD